MINIKDFFLENGIALSDKQVFQFNKYFEMLIENNKVMNLTSITEFDDVVIKHYYDSILPYKSFYKNSKIIDIGTGAGFPAIPLKILRSDLEFVLVDSLNKRVNFIKEVVKELDLKGVEVVHSRSEDLALDKNYREKFDFCISRAVAKLNTLLELCIPFIKIKGMMLAYKGSNYEDEISISKNALSVLNCKIYKIEKFELPFNYGLRNIIFIEKTGKTTDKYPRKNNLPKNKPL